MGKIFIATVVFAAWPIAAWVAMRRNPELQRDAASASLSRGWLWPFGYAAILLARQPAGGAWLHRMLMAEIQLRGESGAHGRMLRRLAEMLAACYALSFMGVVGGLLTGDPAWVMALFTFAVLLPFYRFQRLMRRVEWRKRQILLELPLVINKIVLLLQSGETLPRALRSAADAPERGEHPLYEELRGMMDHWNHHQSFAGAVDRFARRCAVHEASVFANSLQMHYRRGGEDLADALRALGAELWSQRKAMARTLGEEASAKLVFPMVVIFLVVMVIVATPAMFHMNH